MANENNEFNLNESISFLVDTFKIERYIYLSLTFISTLVLLVLCAYSLFEKLEYGKILAMLAPTGGITFACSKFLTMWTDCIELTKTYISSQNKQVKE